MMSQNSFRWTGHLSKVAETAIFIHQPQKPHCQEILHRKCRNKGSSIRPNNINTQGTPATEKYRKGMKK
jgi:hypothetical protein